ITLSTSLLVLKKNRKRPGLVTMMDLSQTQLDHKTISNMRGIFEYEAYVTEIPFIKVHITDIINNNYRLKPIDYLQPQTHYATATLENVTSELKALKGQFDDAYKVWINLI
ncbi:MAG: hypothetical protein JXR42_00275, partial [Gammaproteobacteria bacterium]|nr:hypothetical protein [Gammaproteobacteria bacterium]